MGNMGTDSDFDLFHPQPLLVVLSGPSGAGKDTVIQRMKERGLPFHFVVTATTRPPRQGEVHGRDYFFLSREEFERMIANNELIEYAMVYQEYKGVPREQIRQALASGKDVVMRVDVQGAATLRKLAPQAVFIFLAPSSEEEMARRLRQRQHDPSEDIRLRLAMARQELQRATEFDYVIVNADGHLDETVDTVEAIIRAEHHRAVPRQVRL